MIDAVNQRRACHIITIEDPIEYVHRHKKAAISQREIGLDTDSFARALRSALREDPDVLLVGEMRDPETIQTALTIAETGHLVFATLHTNDVGQAVDRIVDVFPGDKQAQIRVQLAGSLTGIVSQRLMPRIGGGRVAAFEVLVGDVRGAQPDPRGQEQPAPQRREHRGQVRHADPRDGPVAARDRPARSTTRRRSPGASSRTRSPGRPASPRWPPPVA